MYDFLRGRLVRTNGDETVLDVGGIGFRLTVPLSTSSTLPEAEAEVQLLTEFIVREDEQRLFGFATAVERRMFRMLLAVNGVGPSVAIAIVSALSLAEFRGAILTEDGKTLQAVKGVGRRLSQRLIVELKDAMRELEDVGPAPAEGRGVDDAVLALEALGYARRDAVAAVTKAVDVGADAGDPGELVRAALRHL